MIIQAELKCKQTGCEADPCAVDRLIGLTTPTVGNVDLDPFGYVDENDVNLLRQYLANETTFSGDLLAQADVNKDNKVDSTDLSLLEQYVRGEITTFTAKS